MRYVKILTAFVMACVLAACGGGGGTPINGGGNGGGGVTPPGVATMAVSVTNSSGAAVPSVSVGGAFSARATLKDAAGVAIAGRLVTFSVSDTAITTVTPATALTDASGVAQVAIAPASLSALGAATLTASALVAEATVTGSVDFAVSSSSLTLSALSVAATSLPSGGNTTMSTTAAIGGSAAVGIPVNVAFAASCGRVNGQDASAGSVGVTTNGSGVAEASYVAVDASGRPCSGSVTLTATSAGATSQTATITVAAPVANTVTFVGAAPQQIFIAGAGAVEQSVLQFRVLSSVGSPLANVSVVFRIDTNPGGVGLGTSGAPGPLTATSDQDGLVSVSVFSGTIPGPVKLRAELAISPSIFAESQNLTVASGPPSQRFMSLSSVQSSLEGWQRDGVSTTLTVRVADRQGNAVDDGTVVNFTAEGGQVARSCATARGSDGISLCSVSFVTQNPRPSDGRVSVLAYLSGTKNYTDVNGNNKFDAGVDDLERSGDAYRDDNENGVADAGEFVIPRGEVGTCLPVADQDQRFPSRAGTCGTGLATTVRQQLVLSFSSSEPEIPTPTGSALSVQRSKVSFKLRSLHNRLLPMPAGTSISATSPNSSCLIQVDGSPVVNVIPRTGNALRSTPEDLATAVELNLTGCAMNDTLTIKVTAPSGLATSFSVNLP